MSLISNQPVKPALFLGPALVVAAIVSGPQTVTAQVYTFTKIADTVQNPGVAGPYCVGLNDQGMVIATISGAQDAEIWRGNGALFSHVAPTSSVCSSSNALGELGYMTYDPSTAVTALVRNSDGALTLLASSSTHPFLFAGTTYLPALSLSGSAVFQGGPFQDGIYIGPSGPPVYDPTNQDRPLINATTASMNDSHTVAFFATRPDPNAPGGTRNGIYRGSLVALVEEGGPVIEVLGLTRPVINNSGTVAFVGRAIGATQPEVFTTDDGVSFTSVGVAGEDRISINNSGTVAYKGSSGPGFAIFAGSQRVIGAQDPLDGSTVANVFLWEEALNDSGQVAFWAQLQDGRSGIYRADPAALCATDISSSVTVSASPVKLDRKTGIYTQKMTLKHVGNSTYTAPISLVVADLHDVLLLNASGTTNCAAAAGSSYITVDVGSDGAFMPRERVVVLLEFSASPAGYTTRVLSGSER